MSNRPARITQAEIERAIRAAKKAGATEIELKIGDNAAVRIPLTSDKSIADTEEIVL
jgi:2-iminoacetate synthase ThiH